MADHDRDAGSRGEEEAPRDPTPTEPAADSATRHLHQPGMDPEPGGLKYGEQADRAYAYIPPTTPIPDATERPSPFGDWLRRRKTQVVGAGVLGLVVGALLGGVTVSAFDSLTERHGGYDVYLVPDQRFLVPPNVHERCRRMAGDFHCVPPPPVVDHLDRYDDGPTWTG
jgi:hypothetical protein